MKKLLVILLFLSSVVQAQDDVILLKSGQSIKCSIISKTDSILHINLNGTVMDYSLKGVDFYKMDFTWYNSDGSKKDSMNKNYTQTPEKIIDVKIQDELNYMRKNLRLYNDYYYGSYALLVASAGFGIYGAVNYAVDTTSNYSYVNGVKTFETKKKMPVAFFAAAACGAASLIMQLYCHHFIGKAGIGIGGKGVTVRYTF